MDGHVEVGRGVPKFALFFGRFTRLCYHMKSIRRRKLKKRTTFFLPIHGLTCDLITLLSLKTRRKNFQNAWTRYKKDQYWKYTNSMHFRAFYAMFIPNSIIFRLQNGWPPHPLWPTLRRWYILIRIFWCGLAIIHRKDGLLILTSNIVFNCGKKT